MRLYLYFTIFAIASCSQQSATPVAGSRSLLIDSGIRIANVIGNSGGKIESNGMVLTVPEGSLESDVEISVIPTRNAPAGFEPASLVYEFGPSGTQFSIPATIVIPITDPTEKPLVLFWSNESGDFEMIEGTIADGKFTAQVSHFSKGFLGPTSPSAPDEGWEGMCEGDVVTVPKNPNGLAFNAGDWGTCKNAVQGQSNASYGMNNCLYTQAEMCTAKNGAFSSSDHSRSPYYVWVAPNFFLKAGTCNGKAISNWKCVLPPSPTPVTSSLPVPSISVPPMPSVSETPIPSISVPPMPSVSEIPIPSISVPPMPSVSVPPIPSVSIPPMPSPS